MPTSSSQLVEKAHLEQQLVNIAYKVGEVFTEAKAKFLETNANWTILSESHSDAASQESQFKAVAFLNKTTHEVLIAHAGTKVSPLDLKQSIQDVWADGQLAAKITPDLKLKAIKSFVTKIQSELPALPAGEAYNFSTTGHSLGSVLSDLTAVELSSRGLKVNSSVTFDNPGSLPIIKHALENNLFTNNDKNISELKDEIQFSSIQAQNPNVVSRTNEQMGKVFIKVQKSKDSELVKSTENDNVPAEDSGASYVSYLFNKVGDVAKQMAPFLNLKNITTSYELISGYYNPQKLDEMNRNVQTVKDGLIKKVQEEMIKPFEDVKDDVMNIASNLLTIGAGVASIYAGNYAGVVPVAQGAFSLAGNISKLSTDAAVAYNKLAVFANSVAVVGGHSLSNFENISEHNILEVKTGAWVEGAQLIVYANTNNVAGIAKLKEIKAIKEESTEKLQITDAGQNSWSSWVYDKVVNSGYALKDAVAAYTQDLTQHVKVIIENELTVVLSHNELTEFCANNPEAILVGEDPIYNEA